MAQKDWLQVGGWFAGTGVRWWGLLIRGCCSLISLPLQQPPRPPSCKLTALYAACCRTSDEHISIAQFLKASNVDGAIIVTTPQEVSIIDVRKEINFCRKVSRSGHQISLSAVKEQCPGQGTVAAS